MSLMMNIHVLFAWILFLTLENVSSAKSGAVMTVLANGKEYHNLICVRCAGQISEVRGSSLWFLTNCLIDSNSNVITAKVMKNYLIFSFMTTWQNLVHSIFSNAQILVTKKCTQNLNSILTSTDNAQKVFMSAKNATKKFQI